VKLPSLRFPDAVGWRDHLVGAGLAFIYVAALAASAHSLGFMRDETFYFRAGSSYFAWWRSLFEHGSAVIDRGAIDRAFSDNHEHPALMKTLFGASEWFFHERWPVFEDQTTAYRLPGMVMGGVALWTTYLFGARAWSRPAGLVAATLLGAMPHVFFHSHLSCFDVPIMTMWILCTYAHWRAQERRGVGWAIATGVLFGLALETKHNAWFLPVALVPHAFFVHRHAMLRGLRAGRLALPLSVVSMAVLGPLVLIGLWPYLWADTIARLQWWFDFHLNHVYYNIEFLGHNVFEPPAPKIYLPFMVVATVPTVTLVLFGVGAYAAARTGVLRIANWGLSLRHQTAIAPVESDRRETDLLLALSMGVAMAPFFLARTPIFGGTKHWLTAYPALALFAGHGFVIVRDAMRRGLPPLPARIPPIAAEVALFASVAIAPIVVTAHSHPFGISAYVPIVGGTAGGADWGLNRQFWGFTTQDAAQDYLNAKAPPHANVFILDTTYDAWMHMQDEGRVRRDLRAVGGPGESDYALVQHELHMNEVDYSIWMALGTDSPAYVVTHDGVPMVSIYRR
jgi:Dolichyl-phosphate-mannose-protein mannosyltransferase